MSDKDKTAKVLSKFEVFYWTIYYFWQDIFSEKQIFNIESILKKLNVERKLENLILVTFGLIVNVFLILSLITICSSFVYIFTPVNNDLSDEKNLYIAPTIQIVETVKIEEKINHYEAINWLEPIDTLKLRKENNVNNIIFIDNNVVKYSSEDTVYLDESWQNEKPYYLEGVNVDGDSAIIKINGTTYNINTYMPVIWGADPSFLFIIDKDANIFVKDIKDMILLPIGNVQLDQNPSLELGFEKQ